MHFLRAKITVSHLVIFQNILSQKKKIREIICEDQGEGVRDVGCVAECVEESEKEKKKEIVCYGMRVDEMVVVC